MRDSLDEPVDNLARSLDGEDAQLRALLASTGILGRTITKHYLRPRAFDDVSHESLLRAAHRWITSVPGSS